MGRKVFLILDGAADEPILELNGKTPLEAAVTPNLDNLASIGFVGSLWTVPPQFIAASDVANLMLLGYDPGEVYTGRGPLEAAAMGVELVDGDIAFRVNTVSITEDNRMKDYSAGHITTEEARELIVSIQPLVESLGGELFPGVQYRHLMKRRDCFEIHTYPPHDFIGVPIDEIMPSGLLGKIVVETREALKNHPVNNKRRTAEKNTVDALWPWGQGRAIKLKTIQERFGANGALISAVDLVKGIGVLAGFNILQVPGITGYYDTNYKGKAEYAVDALKNGSDIVVIHVESTDEAGHEKDVAEKVKAIEAIDREIVGRLVREINDLAILAAPDHPTLLRTGKHSSEPVPYLIADMKNPVKGPDGFCEKNVIGNPIKGSEPFERLMRL